MNSFTFFHDSDLLFAGTSTKKSARYAAQKIDGAIKSSLAALAFDPFRQEAFERLIFHFRRHTSFLQLHKAQHGATHWDRALFTLTRLRNLAARQKFWVNPSENWRPVSPSVRLEFRSLIRHLFQLYPVPGFMDAAWDLPFSGEGFSRQAWYLRLGRGATFRSLNLPIPYTRRMEHFARQASDHFTIIQALRYGEARSYCENEAFARAIVGTSLGAETKNNLFWQSVVHFLAHHPEIRFAHFQRITNFINQAKFGGEEVFTAKGIELREPPMPDFSLKGRTAASLMRLVNDWDGGSIDNQTGATWPPSVCLPFHFIQNRQDQPALEWEIVELISSNALRSEGRAMHHCVADYAQLCLAGRCSIWSLRLRVAGASRRMATIDLHPARREILQIKSKFNRRPGPASLEVIQRWATLNKLKLDLNHQ